MADDGWKRLSPSEFAALVGPPSDPDLPADTTLPSEPLPAHSLERRLLEAQSQGLSANLRRQLAFIGPRGRTIELQTLGYQRNPNDTFPRVRAAHALSDDIAVQLCTEADAQLSHGVYILMARLRDGVETRHSIPGKWYEIPKGGGTTDPDVEARLILAIDFDVQRPSNTSATNEEISRSIRVATQAWEYLAGALGSEDSLAYLHSGNGRQIHLALGALRADEETKLLAAAVLAGMDSIFSNEEIKVDRKIFDAKRILPACGTLKKKGAVGIEDRPHRRTAIVTPESVSRLSLENLKTLARKIWDDTDDSGRAAMSEAYGARPQKPASTVTPLTPKEGPFARANDVEPMLVVEWLGLVGDSGEVRCPGCGETKGVSLLRAGLKCHHDRCQGKGRSGFRTNVDLVTEARGVSPRDAVTALAEQFRFDGFVEIPQTPPLPAYSGAPINTATSAPKSLPDLPTLDSVLPAAILRAERRADGREKPIPLPWPSLSEHFGGGFWPGVHFICSSTGIGKTTAALQAALFSAKAGYASAYIGLEMEEMQIGIRLIGEHGHIPWSPLYTGNASPSDLDQARGAALDLLSLRLPFHPVFSKPHGWPPSELLRLAESLRVTYPESDGPGSRPLLMVLDFLQIVGEETNDKKELRERISRASYMARDIASRLNMAVVIISSIARDKGLLLSNAVQQAGITFEESADGKPINRRIKNPDALIGIGKESGDIEYAADSLSVITRVPASDHDVLWITSKSRAAGPHWAPMKFTGFRYEEPADGGADCVLAFKGVAQKRAELKQAAVQEKLDRCTEDAVSIVRYVLANPGCSVRSARGAVVNDDQRRWNAARTVLGDAMIPPVGAPSGTKIQLKIIVEKLTSIVFRALSVNNSSQHPTVDTTVDNDVHGSSTVPRTVDKNPWSGRAPEGLPDLSTVHGGVDGGPNTVDNQEAWTELSTVADVEQMLTWKADFLDPEESAMDAGWDEDRIEVALGRLPGAFGVKAATPAPTPAPEPLGGAPTAEEEQAELDADQLATLSFSEGANLMRKWTKERRWRAKSAKANREKKP